LIFFLFSAYGSEEGRDLYEVAEEMIKDYNSHTLDILYLKQTLEKSLELGVVEALTRLGELYFFGFPISPDNPSFNSEFIDEKGHFKHDIPKAMSYFIQAGNYGDTDALFYLSLLYQQDKIVSDFEEYLYSFTFNNVQETYAKVDDFDSILLRAASASAFTTCRNLNPEFLDLVSNISQVEFIQVPFISESCPLDCNEYAIYAYSVAEDTIKNIAKLGSDEQDLVILEEIDESYDDHEAEKILNLATMQAEHRGGAGAMNLAENYLFGNQEAGIERNPEQAIRYYQMAAEDGNVRALENLGLFHIQGIGTEKNTTLALEYLEEAKSHGSVQAYNLLGYIYFNGAGLPQDIEKAINYMQKAADMGSKESMSNLGIAYLHGAGVQKSLAKAYKLFDTAAELGHTPALFNKAYMIYQGLGVNSSCEDAIGLYIKVINRGKLAHYGQRAYSFFRNGNYLGAYLNYMLAGAVGFKNAIINLAYMWESGLAPFHCRDAKMHCAASYYSLAAISSQSSYAYYKLGNIAFDKEYFESAYLLYLNAEDDIGAAAFNLAYMRQFGIGTSISLEKAESDYENIIYKSRAEIYDHADMFPAYFALYYMKLKRFAQNLPLVNTLW